MTKVGSDGRVRFGKNTSLSNKITPILVTVPALKRILDKHVRLIQKELSGGGLPTKPHSPSGTIWSALFHTALTNIVMTVRINRPDR